jgi:predicted small lipoprotein YifL
MLKTKQILVRVIALAGCALNIVGCGQTGSLYLPAPDAAITTQPSAQVKPAVPGSPLNTTAK